MGARFDGLRVLWQIADPGSVRLTLEGAGIELVIPDVLALKGNVRLIDEQARKGFKGGVKLTLYSINLTVDAEVLVVKEGDITALYVYVSSDFPAGIPLASTGVALYGLAGLYGQNVAPDKTEQQHWYEDWYKREPSGVTSTEKWSVESDAMAFGAGVTVGTATDNGYAINGKLLLVILLPGPVILLEGRANLLTERSKLSDVTSEPTFEALAVLDGRGGQLLIDVAVQYKKDDEGRLLDIRAGAEAFFDFHRADAWHLYLGQEDPREKRIRAAVLSLLEAESYLMLSARDLRMGFWAGFDEDWKFGPLRVGLSAWIAAGIAVSWKPVQFHGELQLHGGVELTAFGFGVSIEVDAAIEADTATPYAVLAHLRVKLGLPWPLPDLKANLELEWTEPPEAPPAPLPLAAISCEHLKVSETWPLERFPLHDRDGDGFPDDDAPVAIEESEVLLRAPVVPPDVRPVISFAKPVFDNAGFGAAREGIQERVGETTFEYHLSEVRLERKRAEHDDWSTVAVRSADQHDEALRATWQMVNGGNDALPNCRLMLWSRSTYDWSREQTGPVYWNWLRGQLSDADCPTRSPRIHRCVDWRKVTTGTRYPGPFTRDGLEFARTYYQPAMSVSVPSAGCVRAGARHPAYSYQRPSASSANHLGISPRYRRGHATNRHAGKNNRESAFAELSGGARHH